MKILNFGSLNIDFVYTVEHFVRPGETLSSLSLNRFCGGKGLNQSVALARAKAEVWHAGKIGHDGDMLSKRLRANGVNLDYLIEDEYIPTGHAIIQVDASGQNSILLFGGANAAVTEEDADRILSNFGEGDVLLLQNEISSLAYIMTRAAEKGMRIALNPSPMSEALAAMPQLNNVEWFLLNEVEGNQLTGETDPHEIAHAMRQKFPNARIVLTLGKSGVLYTDATQTHAHGVYKVDVVDTTAAGDTFTGFFLASVCKGESVPEALRIASVASSIAVSRNGASDSIPFLADVLSSDIQQV